MNLPTDISTDLLTVPPITGEVFLGRTLVSLLDEGCDRVCNPHAFNQWRKGGWQPTSNHVFRKMVEEVALGLIGLGIQRGDRIALLMHSDTNFGIADLGSLLAGIVNVPIDLTQTIENILFILNHTEARALIVSDLDLLTQMMPYLWDVPRLETMIVAEVPHNWSSKRRHWQKLGETDSAVGSTVTDPETACLHLPMALAEEGPESAAIALPPGTQLLSLAEVRAKGRSRRSPETLHKLRQQCQPQDLATILYIAGAKGDPNGVMLTHENISADILTSFANYSNLERGPKEVALLFLPLTHVFARAFFYGHLAYGHTVYFSTPNRIVRHLKDVRPTILITVPRLMEKVYEKLLEQRNQLTGSQRRIFDWAVSLAQQYELGRPPGIWYAHQLLVADPVVFAKWRAVFGGRLKALLCGGAALRAELANFFAAVGIPLMQGYGLTETSAVLCFNRGTSNRAGTVGLPIPGADLAIAADGEILAKGPYLFQGYYREPEATRLAIDAAGWFHTGDLGQVTSEGFLQITGIKKSLFKLVTGKYVMSEPLEQQLQQSPLVQRAIAVGANQKFCGMLILPNLEELQQQVQGMGLAVPSAELLTHPCILALYQALIDAANCHLPHWSTVKGFRLVQAPAADITRANVTELFAADLAALYGDKTEGERVSEEIAAQSPLACPITPVSSSCPTIARSLIH